MSEEKPTCHDSTTISKHHLMFSIDQAGYKKEIRVVETPDGYPRLCIIDNEQHNSDHAKFFEINSKEAFDQLYKCLFAFVSSKQTEAKQP